MSGDISIHDNHILSYTVDCQHQQIILRTIFPQGEAPEHTDIIFLGVAAHHFERSNLDTILFDIREASLEEVYDEYRGVFERNKNYGWPVARYSTEEELIAQLKAQGVKGFILISSYGLDGFVLAQEMQIVMASIDAERLS